MVCVPGERNSANNEGFESQVATSLEQMIALTSADISIELDIMRLTIIRCEVHNRVGERKGLSHEVRWLFRC